MGRNRIITQDEHQETIQRLSRRSRKLKVAVSYCGKNASDFFPEKFRPSDIKCIIDMDKGTVAMGLTDPMGVSQLCQIGKVRNLPALHAKVVIFDNKAAIVGSTNFSKNSVENQYQCSILTTDHKTIKQLSNWFESIWKLGTDVDQKICLNLKKMFPKKTFGFVRKKKKAKTKLKEWGHKLLEQTLLPGDFDIESKSLLKHALKLFKTSQCGYEEEKRITCFKAASAGEEYHRELSRDFRRLLKRINRWGKTDKEELFHLAHENAGAAMIGKPRFLRHPVKKIKETMRYLFLNDEGHPLMRFEQAVNGHYKLPGMGHAGLAFLMYLWKPQEYAIWNGAVDKGFKVLKVIFPRPFSTHVAQGYQDRIAALKKIGQLTKLHSFKQIDHFVDAFGKNHIRI